MRIFLALVVSPTIALAQASFPTEWPSGSQPLLPDTLRQRLVGKTFIAKSVTGPDVRTAYQETYAYINVGNTSDSGTWKTEASTYATSGRSCDPLAPKSEPSVKPSM